MRPVGKIPEMVHVLLENFPVSMNETLFYSTQTTKKQEAETNVRSWTFAFGDRS